MTDGSRAKLAQSERSEREALRAPWAECAAFRTADGFFVTMAAWRCACTEEDGEGGEDGRPGSGGVVVVVVAPHDMAGGFLAAAALLSVKKS
ncbi:unnamed protein product [Lampetra fluviatilis]